MPSTRLFASISFVIISATSLLASETGAGQEGRIIAPITTPGVSGAIHKWNRSVTGYIHAPYPFAKKLPSQDKIPEIVQYLDQHAVKHPKSVGVQQALAQLHSLTRVAFFTDEMKNTYDAAAWRNWWKEVGADFHSRLERDGSPAPEAWRPLAGYAPTLTCPTYKILIPDEWRFEVTFRTGDYFGKVDEVITMERKKNSASLKRRYRTHTSGEYHYEVYTNSIGGEDGTFTPDDADHFLKTLVYAVDNPWLVKTEIAPHLNTVDGRSWRHYCSSTEWTGVLLPDGKVWMNDDPWYWHGDKPGQRLDPQFATVYPMLCHRYRDRSPGWRPDPDAAPANPKNVDPPKIFPEPRHTSDGK